MKRLLLGISVLLTGISLTGCGALTGFANAQDEFGCGLPGGVRCQSLSDVYERENKSIDNAEPPVMANQAGGGEKVDDLPEANEKTLKGSTQERVSGKENQSALHQRVSQKEEIKKDPIRRLIEVPVHTEPFIPNRPVRTPEEVRDLWILPWVDSEGDLHGASHIWVRIKDSSWRLDAERARAYRNEKMN